MPEACRTRREDRTHQRNTQLAEFHPFPKANSPGRTLGLWPLGNSTRIWQRRCRVHPLHNHSKSKQELGHEFQRVRLDSFHLHFLESQKKNAPPFFNDDESSPKFAWPSSAAQHTRTASTWPPSTAAPTTPPPAVTLPSAACTLRRPRRHPHPRNQSPHLRRGGTSPFLTTGHRSGPERRRPLLHLLHGRQHRSSGLGGTRISAIGGGRFSSTKDGAHDASFSTHDSQSFLAGSQHRGQWPAAGPQPAHGGPDRGKKRRGRRRRGRLWRRRQRRTPTPAALHGAAAVVPRSGGAS